MLTVRLSFVKFYRTFKNLPKPDLQRYVTKNRPCRSMSGEKGCGKNKRRNICPVFV
nr:MAG TPA: hypothetical protein [Caudoviricetes sp.]